METVTVQETRRDAVIGCLLGTAVGDALGLPCEGLSQQRRRRLFGAIEGHRLIFGRGMISDDTEHTILTAQALVICQDSPSRFAQILAARLRVWILLLPAGVGLATLRSCLKLLMGASPERSGVFSAGNGPAMRAAILGVWYGGRPEELKAFVRASARLTHTDPRAEYGAFAVALAAHYAALGSADLAEFLERLRTDLPNDPEARELQRLLRLASDSAAHGESTREFSARVFGRADRVTGYVYQSVPASLHAWMRYPACYRDAVLGVIACGGDTDTTAAITGAIVGAHVGERGIPSEWVDGIAEWPHSVRWIRRLGNFLCSDRRDTPIPKSPSVPVPALILRNMVFLLVVLLTLLRWYVLDAAGVVRSIIRGSFRTDYLRH